MKKTFVLSLAFSALSAAYAAPFTPGNLVVTQVNADGLTAWPTSGSASTVLVKEYTPNGTLVQTLTMPTDGGLTLTNSSTATSEGQITFGGNRFAIAGYFTTTGTASVVNSASTVNPRAVGLIDLNGNIDLSTRLSDAYTSNNIRAAVFDGNSIYTAGTAGTTAGPDVTNGVRRATVGATTSTQISGTPFTTAANIRVVNIFNGKLYFSTGSANLHGLNTFDVALPTTNAAVTNAPGMADIFVSSTAGTNNSTVAPSTYDFAFADENTLYITEDNSNGNAPTNGTPERGGVYKLTYDVTQSKWVLNYVLKAGLPGFTTGTQTRGARSIGVARNSSGQNVIYVVSAEASATTTAVYTAVDLGAGSSFTQVVRSPDFTSFRGVEVVPAAGSSSRTVAGSIDLGSTWSGSSAGANSITATFDINNGAATVTTNLNFVNGVANYSINIPTSVGAGPINLAVKFTTFLQKRRASVALGSTGQNFAMLNGNVDGDTEVSILDYIQLSTAYGLVTGDSGFDPAADLDKDGEVSILDYLILSDNYEKTDE